MRRMRRWLPVSMVALLLGGLLSLTASAEEPSADAKPAMEPAAEAHRGTRPGDAQKVFVLKHVGATVMRDILSVFPAEIRTGEQPGLQVLSVSGAPAVVAAIEETVKRLDVVPPPAKSVDVTGYVLECSAQATPAGASTAPAELQDAIGQLKRTFGYAGCYLAQTLFARARDNADFYSSAMVVEKTPQGASTGPISLGASDVDVDALQSPPLVRFRSLRYQGSGGFFKGDVEVRDGQRVVLGKVGIMEEGKDQVLVLTAKVQN
jgi:hypothetical protein